MRKHKNMSVSIFMVIHLLLACLCYSFVFAAEKTENEPVRVVVSEWVGIPTEVAMDITSIANREVLKAFRKKYPWIEIKRFGGGLRIEGAGAMDIGPLMAIAGGISPDVIYVNFRKSHSYIFQGFLYPLDEYIEKMCKKELNERVPPQTLPVFYREGPDGKKRWWAFPYGTYVICLMYRKDLFRDAGLDPDKPPETWDELLTYARKITDPEKRIFGIGIPRARAAWSTFSFLVSAGARAVEQDEKGNWRAVFNTPEAVEAVYFYTRLVTEKFEKNGKTLYTTASTAGWHEGKIGMIFLYLHDQMISTVNPDLVGIAPVPKGPTGLRASEINCTSAGIFAGVKDKRVRDAAWKFIHFWGGPEAQEIRVRTFVENGYGQFINPALLRKYGYTEYLERVPKGWEEALNESIRNAVPEPYGKNCDLIYMYLSKPMDKAVVEDLGNKPPEVAKKRIKELLDEAVAETNEKMIGEVPPEKMAFRRKVAVAVACIM